ncbi:MEDS domain-containing protein [Nonomuraea rhizosphaerae]|uniref:MEDS domain-containing protein n=1 Tax=Nonomuraea rhizosphaerae TaxID=2665663 RepID=UPI001C5E494B|nr:MEDS domain-containing protein [Nonomuraea rhizosphaerae]
MVKVTGSVLDPDLGDHVCLPFLGERERMAATRVFTANGLRRRTKVVIITHADSPERTREWLAPLVPGFASEEAAGRVTILPATPCAAAEEADTATAGGPADHEWLLGELVAAGEQAREMGCHGVYALVDASWGLRDGRAREAFEAAANALFGERWLAAVCQYDRHLFPSETMDRAAAIHPIAPEQALLRYTNLEEPAGLRLSGDVDVTNRPAFASVLAQLEPVAGDVVIDATGLGFIDAGSAQLMAVTALARPGRATVVLCRRPVARVLRLIRADEAVTVRQVGDV